MKLKQKDKNSNFKKALEESFGVWKDKPKEEIEEIP